MEALLLRHAKKVAFKVQETIRMLPGGAGRQALHQEEGQWPIAKGWAVGEEYTVDLLFALTEFTEANGATHVIPGSNLWSGRGGRVDNAMPTVRAEMDAGSVLVLTGSAAHAGGSNHGTAPRLGLAMGYQVGWLRPEANHVLGVPPVEARALPAPIQELLGYPLRYTPTSTPTKYVARPGALAYRSASSYACVGGHSQGTLSFGPRARLHWRPGGEASLIPHSLVH